MHELNDEVEERNYAKQPLTRAELGEIVDAAGGVAAVLNTRHATAKANGWKDAPPGKKAFIDAAVEENNLVRRPVLIRGGEAVVGKDEAAIRALLS